MREDAEVEVRQFCDGIRLRCDYCEAVSRAYSTELLEGQEVPEGLWFILFDGWAQIGKDAHACPECVKKMGEIKGKE